MEEVFEKNTLFHVQPRQSPPQQVQGVAGGGITDALPAPGSVDDPDIGFPLPRNGRIDKAHRVAPVVRVGTCHPGNGQGQVGPSQGADSMARATGSDTAPY